eukprot:CAMPEP_0183714190 /NCGR_PEP_ID=MMETSP0737-20130205/8809_1 /TAXON_ID=385413 /ORGANISM="Thalassiosira miniscula, Strain CCMP1093" /LENGTH=939 /DNA_ID=CAMNT_0025943095 /DNA_START=322 /DNA_END=3141 /DNA_ORIENTATION=-
MYSVAEETDGDDHDGLADFGLQHLESPRDHGNDHEAPLLDNDHTVDELICNPMGNMSSDDQSPTHRRQHTNNNNNNQRNNNKEESFDTFVLLKRLRILPKNDGYAYVSDLDAFFSSLYNYYYMRGFGSIVGKGIVELVSLFFTLWLSLILFAYIDWRALSHCNDEQSCHESFREAYLVQHPFSSSNLLRNSWIVIYCLLFSIYGLFCLVQYGHTLVASLESKLFLEEVLAVSDRDLEVGRVEWGDIVERMSEAQRLGKCRVAILPTSAVGGAVGDASQLRSHASMSQQQEQNSEDDLPTGHLVVAQRIMRRENYMISFFNKGLFDLTIPPIPIWPLSNLTNQPREEKTTFFSKSIEWSIYFCVLNYMFNHSRKIRPAFYGDPSSLRRRFQLCGIAHLIFMPFLLFFVTLHFFMSNAYDWQSTKEYMGPREWSSMARWKFREFNELPHSFERRMEPSYKSAAAYLDMFGRPSPFKVALGRLLVFVSGSLGTLLLAFAAMNDAILLHVKIGQWNLLWYAGVLGVCFSVGKGMIPKSTSPHFGHARRNLIDDMNSELEKLATHTHYLPDSWRGKGWHDRTKKAFAPMFQFKANHFAMEILSIMAAPLVLCVSLPRCAEKLCRFVRDSRVEVPGVGDMVGYSTFDFDSFEDENWRGRSHMDHSSKLSIRGGSSGDGTIKINDRPKSRHGKMEKSFFNFKGCYPNWTMPPSGKNLVDRVESFRHQQDIALARERRLHIDAAAAQLETLRRLELEKEKRASVGLAGFVDPRHIKSASSGPDSGGGEAPGLNHNLLSHHTHGTLSDFGSTGSAPHAGLHHPMHFAESAHSFAPPSHLFAHSIIHGDNTAGMGNNNNSPVGQGSVMYYADAGLSMELRGLLNGSNLVDPSASQQSFTGSLVPIEDTGASILDIRADHQYMWLDRYHSERVDNTQNNGGIPIARELER